MSQTRRLAAILAADVAGYSRLMGADEEGTHERLKAHLAELVDPKIAEHRGRIVKNTGDGLNLLGFRIRQTLGGGDGCKRQPCQNNGNDASASDSFHGVTSLLPRSVEPLSPRPLPAKFTTIG